MGRSPKAHWAWRNTCRKALVDMLQQTQIPSIFMILIMSISKHLWLSLTFSDSAILALHAWD